MFLFLLYIFVAIVVVVVCRTVNASRQEAVLDQYIPTVDMV